MNNGDIFGMSIRNLFKRKLRTFLTILGVTIGTASIVVMISLGLAMNATFDREIEKMGDITTITVYNSSGGERYYGGGVAVSMSSGASPVQNMAPDLDDNSIASFRLIPGVVAATPISQGYLNFKSGKYIMSCSVYGIDPSAMGALGFRPAVGRLLEDGDKYNIVFGSKAELNFYNKDSREWIDRYWNDFNGEEVETYVDLMTDKIQMSYDYRFMYPEYYQNDYEDEDAVQPPNPITIRTAGILEDKSRDTDRSIYMDISTLQKLMADREKYEKSSMQDSGYYSTNQSNKKAGYDTAYVKCTDLNTVKKVKAVIEEQGFYCEIPTQYLDSMQQVASSLQGLLGAIGAVSLFVAAIGIANTMIMAIYERTKEIGVMKVIGAAIGDIKKLFLLEAAMIGLLGGVFGVLLSIGVSALLNNARLPFLESLFNMYTYSQGEENTALSLITPWLCGAALLFASAVGLVSGYLPAKRAMKLSALSAIRAE